MEHQMAPALFFVFSRKQCESLAKGVHRSVVSSEDSCEISRIWEYELRHYRKVYEKSAQYQELYKLVQKGIAYHHSGLIPVLKEVIEILFEKGLVKRLFATETFAVGVNAPTKTVVFPRLTKYSNNGFRLLRTDEYLQMAGRAGRRGLDKIGRVIIIPLDELMDYAALKKMLTGKSPSIVSKFRLNYQFLLKIINTPEKNLDEFITSSLFSRDNDDEMQFYIKQLDEIQTKCDNGPALSTKDYNLIDEYYKQETQAKKLGGNKRRKQLAKIRREKNSIPNFEKLSNIYNSFNDKITEKNTLERKIDYLKRITYEDIIKMLQFLVDNHYITLKCPITELISSENTSIKPLNTFIEINKKGIVAAEISECNEIILTELIFNGIFDALSQAEIVAVMAAFIEEKTNEEVSFSSLDVTKPLKEALMQINDIALDFEDYENQLRIDISTDWNLYLSFLEPTYSWVCGSEMYEITNKFEGVYEGTFIRNILRISNMIENVKNICTMIGNSSLLKKLENIEELILRDQVTTESLYITKE